MVKTKIRAILLATVVALSGVGMTASAQITTDYAKKQMKEKATKEAKNEAKKYQKAGWEVKPGALPLERQLDKAYEMAYDVNEEGDAKYVMGNGSSTAAVYDAAKAQALEMARQDIATQIESELTTEVESTLSNQQLNQDEAATVIKVIQGSKGIVSQSLGRLNIIVEAYKNTKKDNVEVLVRVAYNYDNVKKAYKSKILEELEKRGDELHKKFDSSVK